MNLKRIRARLIGCLIDIYHFLLTCPWKNRLRLKDGYTIILPIVPDFYGVTEYNLRFLSACNLPNCDRVLVVTDSHRFQKKNLQVLEHYRDRLPLRYLVIPWHRRFLMRIHRRSFVVHTTNFVTGINQSRTKYCFLHDADFFITDHDHIERLYEECQHDRLDMLSSYSRPHPGKDYAQSEDIVFPATFELMVRRGFMTSSPAYKIFAGEWDGKWHGNFVRFFLSVRNEKCRMLDTPGGDPRYIEEEDAERLPPGVPIPVGLHFKHLFERYWKFLDQGKRFDEGKYTMFFLYITASANEGCSDQYFSSMDEYLGSVQPAYRSAYYGPFERYFLQFVEQDALTASEREIMLRGFETLKEAIESNETAALSSG